VIAPSNDDPACRLCGEPVDVLEDWCFGCRAWVCEDCVGDRMLIVGTHKVTDHEWVQ
jgi:hypothetical protein